MKFFPHLLSVLFFCFILTGLFLLFTQLYPPLILSFQQKTKPSPKPENTVVVDLVPSIQGSYQGSQIANRTAEVSTAPLLVNALKGYQAGISTALLASRNWFDLDSQLFRVQASALGMKISAQMSVSELGRGTNPYQVLLIEKIQSSLAVNLDEFLSGQGEKRKELLSSFLTGLRQLSLDAVSEIENLNRSIAESETLAAQFADQAAGLSQDAATPNSKNIEAYLEARKKAEELKLQSIFPKQLLAQLAPLQKQLDLLISALDANFEALAAGIKVTPIRGVSLPIFKE